MLFLNIIFFGRFRSFSLVRGCFKFYLVFGVDFFLVVGEGYICLFFLLLDFLKIFFRELIIFCNEVRCYFGICCKFTCFFGEVRIL